MAYLSLYRKYRVQTFEELLGQDAVARTLAHAVDESRVAHAYLFTGPRGTGKTSTARILAKALNCSRGPTSRPCGECESCVAITEGSSLDVIEIDAASHSKVDETREILAGVPLATAGSRRKVYVIDEVHMLSPPSFNALLKTLEEPPEHVLFILATTEAHKVLPTIISRTQRFDFRPVATHLLEDHLAHIAKLEGIEAEPDALSVVARHADGGVRDALSMLDQLASIGDAVTAADAERLLGERPEDAYSDLFDALAAADVGGVFTTLHGLVGSGADVRQLAVGALGHARTLLLASTAPDAEGLLDVPPEDVARVVEQARRFTPGGLLRILDLLGKSLAEMRNVSNHRMLLELALVRAAAPETDPSGNGLLGRIERLERRLGIEEQASAGAAAERVVPESVAPRAPERPAASPGDSSERGATSDPPAASEPGASAPEAAPAAPVPQEGESAVGEGETGAAAERSATDHVGLNHVKQAWPAVLKEVNKRSKRVWGLLSPSHAADYEDDVLVVEVQAEFHQSTMAEEHNRSLLADSVHAALGIRPQLSFTAARRAGATVAPEAEIADAAGAAPVEARSQDPVELVKKGFKAEVVEEQER